MTERLPESHAPGRGTNRLAGESSPYLLQHAHNPVAWWPWGDAAFAEARRRDAPIFLSIGYSTCYWCHVMERESFESEAIARLLNDTFVCIKVDREERPDVDEVYMAALQAMTGSGGWPMSVFLEPRELRPFWCGTYLPDTPRFAGRPAFGQVIGAIDQAWRTQRDEVEAQAARLADAVRERLQDRAAPVRIGVDQVNEAVSSLLAMHDRVNGGFGGAPKFPQPVYLELLLAFRPFAGDEATRAAVDAALRKTLDAMATGGVFDQVGGGFHRYSVDAKWRIPHFEKMLYDNAQLAGVYARAARMFDDPFYAGVARRTLDYVLREMTGPDGGFYSAQDAEVDGREGQNYLWTGEQLAAVLGGEDGTFASEVYGVRAEPGHFRDPHHPDGEPANVLFLAARPEPASSRAGPDDDGLAERLASINKRLLAARQARKQPRLDDKVITSWNGLMIGAMAIAGSALADDRFVEAARRAAEFVMVRLRGPGGELLRSWRGGTPGPAATLEDYAMLAHGLIELHRAGRSENGRFLGEAIRIMAEAQSFFGDPSDAARGGGGYFDTREGRTDLFVRPRTLYDGAVPSGASYMANNWLDLHEAFDGGDHIASAAAAIRSASRFIAGSPVGAAGSTRALLRLAVADGPLLARTFEGLDAPGTLPADDPDFTPVEVLASTDRVTLGEHEPQSLSLRLRIKGGYHIVAADPGPGGHDLFPLRIRIAGGSGVGVYADYPPGEPYGENDELSIYRGEVDIPVVLEREGAWAGRPLLAVAFQACTDEACLRPRIVELGVAIDRT